MSTSDNWRTKATLGRFKGRDVAAIAAQFLDDDGVWKDVRVFSVRVAELPQLIADLALIQGEASREAVARVQRPQDASSTSAPPSRSGETDGRL